MKMSFVKLCGNLLEFHSAKNFEYHEKVFTEEVSFLPAFTFTNRLWENDNKQLTTGATPY